MNTTPSMPELAGRVVIVTGGGSGIGRAIALRAAAAGARVTVVGRREEPLAGTVTDAVGLSGEVTAASCDVRDAEAVLAMVDGVVARSGRVDALVNNAAGNFVCAAEELSPNGWRAVIDIVLNGTFHVTRAAAPHMLRAGRGVVLNVIASYAWHGHPGTVHSAAAKAGVLAMSRTMAVEWGGRGIRVNCLAPGPTETAGAGQALWPTPHDRARVLASVPAGRFASPDEVAETALFLLDDRSSYVNGEVLTVDGGQWLGKAVYGEVRVDETGANGAVR